MADDFAVGDGKPLADRTVEVDPFPGVLEALMRRPPRNSETLFEAPGRTEQDRVDVPVRPGDAGR